jgi:penicillin amidase
MRALGFFFSLLLTLALTIALETPFGSVPPLGKFLSPNHGFWQNAETDSAFDYIELNHAYLQDEVEILIDENLVPHIYAQNDMDLYFAQGYIMAKHRLWQMDFQVRAAAGRIAEIIGPDAIEFDRLQRRKGMTFGAENGLRAFTNDPIINKLLDSYTAGINHYIEQLKERDYPIEYKLLSYSPEKWEPLKSALFLKYMADMLAGGDSDLENTNFVELFGKERYAFLFPNRFSDPDPVIPSEKVWDFEPAPVEKPVQGNYPWANIGETYEKPNPLNGSNNWAVAGSKTASGKPILAGDPHLSLNLPSIWYLMHLNTPDVNVMGAALPGSPNIIIGFTNEVAWSVTNATRDVRDWYKITFRDAEKKEYLYDGNWLKTQLRQEEIEVKGGETFIDSVYYTHHGPVVYDASFNSNGGELEGYALRWIAHEPSKEVLTFYYLNRAKNYEDYVKALSYYVSPAQNFAFASNQGDIALWVQGKFPLKWEEQGEFLMDGSKSAYEWKDYIPQPHNPHIVNPERAFISSANQQPHDLSYPYWGYDHTYEAWRNRRINERLNAMDNITIGQMMSLQSDNYNLKAAETLPIMIEMLDRSSLTELQSSTLKDVLTWDYFNEVGAKGASIWEIWWEKVRVLTNTKYRNAGKTLRMPGEYRLQQLLKSHPNDPHFDLEDTPEVEIARDIVRMAFTMAVDSLEKWKAAHEDNEYFWADFKNTTIQHLLPPLQPFHVPGVQIGGNRNIVNATSGRHGASWRMVVELGDKPIAFGIYPGGQSGNPGSAFYTNMIENWAKGQYLELHAHQQEDARKGNIKQTITLKPNEN